MQQAGNTGRNEKLSPSPSPQQSFVAQMFGGLGQDDKADNKAGSIVQKPDAKQSQPPPAISKADLGKKMLDSADQLVNKAKLHMFVQQYAGQIEYEDADAFWIDDTDAMGERVIGPRLATVIIANRLNKDATLQTNFDELWPAYVHAKLGVAIESALTFLRGECKANPAVRNLTFGQLILGDSDEARSQFIGLMLLNKSSDAPRSKGQWQRRGQTADDNTSRHKIAYWFLTNYRASNVL